MSLAASTTLAATCAAGDNILNLTLATAATAGKTLKVGHEKMKVQAAPVGTTVLVARGLEGTKAVAHNLLTPVAIGDAADFPTVSNEPPIQTYGASGAIAVPNGDGNGDIITIILNKATAAAMTLVAPTTAQDGLTLNIISETAAAHTVTYTAGFLGGTTSDDVATFAAAIGASMTVKAINGTWGVLATASVTIA